MANLTLNNKYNRRNFIPTFYDEGTGITEMALSDSNWIRFFELKYPTTTYEIKNGELGRPDLISFGAYSRADYWWVILKFNDIIDPFYELNETGIKLQIPNIKDIQDYYMNVKNRRRVAGGIGRKNS